MKKAPAEPLTLETPLEKAGFSKPYREFFARKGFERAADLLSFPPRRILSFQHHEDLTAYINGKVALILTVESVEIKDGKHFIFLHAKDAYGHTFKVLSYQKRQWGNVLPSVLQKHGSVRMIAYGYLRTNRLDTSDDAADYFFEAQLLDFYSKDALTQPVYWADQADNNKTAKAIVSLLSKASFSDSLDGLLPDYLPDFDAMLRHLHCPASQAEYDGAVNRFVVMALLAFFLRRDRTVELLTAYDQPPRPLPCKRIVQPLPFDLNESQEQAIAAILEDMGKGKSSLRYILGEVGAGKSVIAYEAAYAIVHAKVDAGAPPPRVFILAPTLVLATQHYKTFLSYHPDMKERTVLATGQTKVDSIQPYSVIIGTHAIFKYKKLHADLVVVDEPQKFGIQQQKWGSPTRYVFLTATPLPRWTAMLLSGGIQVNELDTRERNVTPVLLPFSETMIEKLMATLPPERKKMIVVPKISSSLGNYPNLEDVAAFLEARGTPFTAIHGKMAEKGQVVSSIEAFRENEVTTLLATQMIEAGLDIPDAKYIVIIAPEAFGFLGLWQLMGRVGRDGSQAYAYLLTYTKERLEEFVSSVKSGYDAAKLDLLKRGTGALDEVEQSGIIKIPLGERISPPLIKVATEIYNGLLANQAEKLPQIREELDSFFRRYF